MSVFRLSLLLAAAAFFLGVPAPGVHAVEVTDATGRTVTVTDTSRVLAVGGSVTEILYALGLQDQIIAVDTTSVYPREALADKPNVGYMRSLSAEGVLSLNPTLILALEGAGPPNVIDVLQKASVQFIAVRDDPTATGAVDKIRFISRVMGVREPGEKLALSVETQLKHLEQAVARLPHRQSVLFVLSLSNGRPMVSGANTSAHGILALAGADNAITQFDGFKPVSDEAIIAGAPDAILMMRHVAATTKADDLFALDALAVTPAGEARRLISMDGQYLLGFGPRTARAARDLANELYPESRVPELEDGSIGAQ